MNASILNRPDLTPAARHFTAACAASRAHEAALIAALRRYGSHGNDVSAVGRDHFPDAVKTELRALARAVKAHSDRAYAARPHRVRIATLRKLSAAVASRDGSGFYGPVAS